jgi:hypothetical protein
MEAASLPETLLVKYRIKRHHVAKYFNLHINRHKIVKFWFKDSKFHFTPDGPHTDALVNFGSFHTENEYLPPYSVHEMNRGCDASVMLV